MRVTGVEISASVTEIHWSTRAASFVSEGRRVELGARDATREDETISTEHCGSNEVEKYASQNLVNVSTWLLRQG